METIKINNPLYIGEIAPLIQRYWDKINVHKLNYISYETLYTYMSNVVQFGAEIAEFWVCFKEDEPVGFGMWRVMPLPFQGTVYCEHLFKTVKDHDVTLSLIKNYIEFGKKHHAPFYVFDAVNDVVAKILRKVASEVDGELIETDQIRFIGRLKNG